MPAIWSTNSISSCFCAGLRFSPHWTKACSGGPGETVENAETTGAGWIHFLNRLILYIWVFVHLPGCCRQYFTGSAFSRTVYGPCQRARNFQECFKVEGAPGCLVGNPRAGPASCRPSYWLASMCSWTIGFTLLIHSCISWTNLTRKRKGEGCSSHTSTSSSPLGHRPKRSSKLWSR